MNEDDALMERARGGDAGAFDAIVRRHQHRLQRFATRMAGGDAARGADVAVGAFLRLWEGRTAYRSEGKLGAWLLQTAYRLVVDESRREKPSVELGDETARVESAHIPVERSALAQAVREAVAALPEGHRAVVVLSHYEGLGYDEIAEALAISPGTVASRRSHAMKTLRRRLAAWDELP